MKQLEFNERELELVRLSLISAMLEIDNKASELFCIDRTDEEHDRLIKLSNQSAEYHFLLSKLKQSEH